MELKNKITKAFSSKQRALSSLGFLAFVFLVIPAKAEVSENWKIFEDPNLLGISGCFGSTENSTQYYYNNILHYALLLKFKDGYFPVAIVNAYHPTGEPVEPDLKYDPSVGALEFMGINGYVSSPNGMWGLYIIDFLEQQDFIALGENRSPEKIIALANQVHCPEEVPEEFYQEIFEDSGQN